MKIEWLKYNTWPILVTTKTKYFRQEYQIIPIHMVMCLFDVQLTYYPLHCWVYSLYIQHTLCVHVLCTLSSLFTLSKKSSLFTIKLITYQKSLHITQGYHSLGHLAIQIFVDSDHWIKYFSSLNKSILWVQHQISKNLL